VANEYRDNSRPGRVAYNPHQRGGRGSHSGDRRGIPLSDLDATTTEASRKVIGCSIEVHRALGPGYCASVYAKALKKELADQGVKFVADHRIPVKYKDEVIGEVCAELFIENLFLVRVSARPGPVSTFERLELRSQLKAADLDLGLIVNFAERRLKDGLVRVLNIDKLKPTLGYDEFEGEDPEGGSARINDFDVGR
jgi:GxxExxY protein